MLANRLGGRKFTKSHLGRPFAGRLRANESHVDDISYTFTKSSPSVGRRGSRAITRLGTRHIGDSLKTLQQYGTIREKINEYNDTWDVDNEPGYQLNATPITPTTTEKRESQTLGDCNSNDRFNASNIYPSLSPSSTNPFYHHHSSIMSNDRSLSTLYEAHLQNRSYPEDNLPSFSSQSKLFRSSGTPMNWSHLLCPNQSNTGTSPSTTVSLTSSSTSSCVLSSSSPMDSCRITEQSDNVCTPRHSDSNNESVMHVGELSANHEPSPHRISPIHRANMSKLSNSVNVVNRNNSVPIPTDSAHSTTSINNTVAVVNPTFSNIDHKSNNNNNNNNNTLNTQGNSNMMRTVDFSSVTDKSNNGRVVGDLQTFVNPQTATTTVTFFICEVCSSRYRSTAGLRYHYHSQHSGYTPQNPISASASRLVVPVGEERGIGGGLRGGRPRRHRGSTASSKSRDKSSNSHYSTEYQGSSEQDERSNSFLAAHYSRASNQSTNAYSPSQSNKRGNNTNRADSKPIDSRSIVEPKLIDLITNQPTSSKYREKGHPNHFNSVESDGSNGNNSNTNELSNNNSMSSVEMKKSSFFMNSNNGDRFPQCSMPSSSVTVGKFIDSTDSLNLSNASSRYQVMDYTSNSNPTISSSSIGSIPHSNILSAQQQNSLQLSSFNSLETHFGNSMPNNKVHPYIPYSHHHPYQSTLQQPQPSTQNWNSQHTGFNQLSFVPSSVPNSHSSFPRPPQQQQSSTIISRIGPQQRRYERQHCADRLGLVRSPVNPSTSTSSMLLPSSSSTCDYCLGDDTLNPRIGHPEGMLQCSRCGHSAHYTCLRLPPHIIDAAMRYPWQCIECKTCWLCDQDDHEDRMIFCWDCDRVFHAHCLQSRLPRNPDTHWTCDICLHEMYNVSNSSIEQRAHSNSGYEAYSSNNSSSHNNNSSLNQVNNADGYYTNVQHYAHNIPRL
ncbi:unnamed protein product [Heterobilharzia americana]|nr:unnamed protein product [Heterobilharzia americana]